MAGPTLPPDDDAEFPEDDEGRLEGGGLTDREKEILDFMDQEDVDDKQVELEIPELDASIEPAIIADGYFYTSRVLFAWELGRKNRSTMASQTGAQF